MKLAINTLLSVQVSATAELICLMRHAGLDAAKAIEIVSSTPVASPAAKVAAAAMIAVNFAPMFPVDLAEKDLGYVLEMARSSGARLPFAEAARSVFKQGIARGHGPDNITAVIKLYP